MTRQNHVATHPASTSRKRIISRAALLVAAAAASPALGQATPSPTAFTYQGELKQTGVVVSGLYDFQFKLFTAQTGGSQLGSASCADNVTVTNGRFMALVDVGQNWTSPARYLEISVRPDTGLGCGDGTGFTTLSRQLVTSAPLAIQARSAFGLDTPNGSSTNAVSVDSAGRVGIRTTTPGMGLTIASDMEMGTGSGDYRHFRIGGGNSDGFLFGSFPGLGDGIHMAYNFFADAGGNSQIIHTDGGTSRVSTGYGAVRLATGPVGAAPTDRVIVDQDGNVTLGTGSGDYRYISLGGGNSSGFIYGSYPGLGDGIHMGYNFYFDAAGGPQVIHSDGGTSRISTSYGFISLATNGANGFPPIDRLTIDPNGNVHIAGNLSKASGSFKIDDPIDPANKYLSHSFVESPDMMNIYNGLATTDADGYAEVTMPDWFQALNQDFRYQLTVLDDDNTDRFVQAKVVQKIQANHFTIRTSIPGTEVSWQVTGIRHDAWADAHRIPVEEPKSEADRGKYLNPEVFGQPATCAIGSHPAAAPADPSASPLVTAASPR